MTRAPYKKQPEISESLAESKLVRMRVLMRVAERNLDKQRASHVERSAIPPFAARLQAIFHEYLDDLPQLLGPEAAGMPFDDVRYFVLAACERRARGIKYDTDRMSLSHLQAPPPIQFDDLNINQLMVVKAKLSAERASLLDRADRGELLDYAAAQFAWKDWVARTIQSKVCYLAGLIDRHLTAATPEQATDIIAKAIDDVYNYLSLWPTRIGLDPMSEDYDQFGT